MREFIQGLYFYTATCNTWKKILLGKNEHEIIMNSMRYFTRQKICKIYGFVIMPNHIHMIVAIHDENLKSFQQRFLKFTAHQIVMLFKKEKNNLLKELHSTQSDRRFHIWERRSKWKAIYNSDEFYNALNYTHNNPLQKHWKLVANPADYISSSALSYKIGVTQFDFLTIYEW
ncbi:MAG: transposase [Bacteroidetes bacterium]|nr:transposase [Bacteroidota bacterium]